MKKTLAILSSLMALTLVGLIDFRNRPHAAEVSSDISKVEEGTLVPMEWEFGAIDPITFEVVTDDSTKDQGREPGEYNSFERIEERRLAALAGENPQEYARLYPKTEEELKLIEECVRSFTVTVSMEEQKALAKDADELKQIERAVLAITNPRALIQILEEEKEAKASAEQAEPAVQN